MIIWIFKNWQSKTAFLSPDQNHVLLLRKLAKYWCLPNQYFFSLDSFTVATISKGQRDDGDVLAITNSHHEPNIYSRQYLSQYNICKLSVCKSPWVVIYLLLSLTTTTTTSLPEETRKFLPLHDKKFQTYPQQTQNILMSYMQVGKMFRQYQSLGAHTQIYQYPQGLVKQWVN